MWGVQSNVWTRLPWRAFGHKNNVKVEAPWLVKVLQHELIIHFEAIARHLQKRLVHSTQTRAQQYYLIAQPFGAAITLEVGVTAFRVSVIAPTNRQNLSIPSQHLRTRKLLLGRVLGILIFFVYIIAPFFLTKFQVYYLKY